MKTRIALSLAAASFLSVTACQLGGKARVSGAPAGGNLAANAAPGTAPAPGVMVATPGETFASIFHDDLSNSDLAQILAWDDSSHTGVFLSVPAAMVAAAGSNVITATTPGVFGRFGVSQEGHNNDCSRQWMFALYSGTLIVQQGAVAPGDTIAVVVSNATFEFVDEHGNVTPSVTAQLGLTDPALTAVVDSEPMYQP
jgi:hypothetical protein